MSSVLDEVLGRVNILDIVSQYVKLRKTGRNFVGLCPFHKEKTPSFSVSVEKQIFYCFGCHEGGNAVAFLAKYDRSTFQEALEGLANQLGIETGKRMGPRRTPVFDALSRLATYYQENLKRSGAVLKYLTERGIGPRVIEEFRLGYSERANYRADFGKRLGVPLDVLYSSGNLKMREGGGETYDIFRGRVVIPILDANGKVVAFGGRAIAKDAVPKYINSPESPFFSKRSTLYGLDKAKREIAEKDEAIIVEGYFDLISLHAAGVRNSVATLGTSVTEDQISRLRNLTENITLMLDGDEAGVKSALRLIGLFGEMGINGSMVVLPDGHDPDSLLRKEGLPGFSRVMEGRKPLLDYFFEFHGKKHGLGTLEGRLGFIRTVIPYLEDIRDSVRRRLYIQRLSELTGVEEYRFWDTIGEKGKESAVGKEDESRSVIERKVVGILLNKPQSVEYFKGKGVEGLIEDKVLGELTSKIIDYVESHGSLDLRVFLDVLERPELREIAVSSAMDVTECDEQEMDKVLSDYLYHAENRLIREEAKGITERLIEAEKRGDKEALKELLEKKLQVVTAMKFKSAK
jgi:DNA primase